jgi:predicted phage-related endonuclease
MSKATVATKAVTVVVEAVSTAVITNPAVTLDEATIAIVDEFVATRTMITELEKTKKELEAKIKDFMGEATVGLLADGKTRLEVSLRERKGIDAELLKNTFPEAYEATQTISKYSVLMPK